MRKRKGKTQGRKEKGGKNINEGKKGGKGVDRSDSKWREQE